MANWRDKTWLITGASSGFGQAAARTIARNGGRVIATARKLEAVAPLAVEYPGQILPLSLDVTSPDQIEAAVCEAEEWGPIDVLMNNSGYGFLGGIEESSTTEIDAQMNVNFHGALSMIRAVLPAMRRRSRGYIVNMSSISGVRGFAGAGFYAASKFALEGLSEALAGEVAPFGIGVLIVEPGYFRTDFSTRSLQAASQPSPDYPQLARRRAQAARAQGSEPGDPDLALAAILSAMEAQEPPRRLPLGSDAHRVVSETLKLRADELETWKPLTISTDFTD